MDKYNTVLDLIEHPGNYSAGQIEEILSDREARDIYNLLCKTRSACTGADDNIADDVDMQWRSFEKKHFKKRRHLIPVSSRAASIAAIAFTSLAAVALGVAVTVGTFEREDNREETQGAAQSPVSEVAKAPADTVITNHEAVFSGDVPVLFEDKSLGDILDYITVQYGASVVYSTPDAEALHLYYRLDPAMPLDKVVESLNTFEQINIRMEGNTLIVD